MSEKQANLGEKSPRARPFTPRQRQVLDLVVRGLGNKAIASELGVSEQGAKEHVSALLRRFGVTGRAALAEVGLRLQILGDTDVDFGWLPYLFVASPIGIQVLRGPAHRVAAVNETNRRVLDREVVGLTFAEAYPHEADRMVPLLDRAYRTGERHVQFEFEGTWLRDGVEQPAFGDFVLQPIRAGDGTVSGVIIFGADVTDRVLDRRRLERLDAEQLAVFDLMNEGVVVADIAGQLLKVNEAARRITGMPEMTRLRRERLAEFDFRDGTGRRLHWDEVPLVRAIAGADVPWSDYILLRPADRTEVRLRVAASPLRGTDGTVMGGVVVFRRARGS